MFPAAVQKEPPPTGSPEAEVCLGMCRWIGSNQVEMILSLTCATSDKPAQNVRLTPQDHAHRSSTLRRVDVDMWLISTRRIVLVDTLPTRTTSILRPCARG